MLEPQNNQIKQKKLEIDTGIPLYYQIKEIIMQRISSGYYKSGDLIPPEELLAKEFSVSQGTVRRAMSDLVNTEVLYRRSGYGTIVKEKKLEYSVGKLYGFSEILKEKGFRPSSKVLKYEILNAEKAKVTEQLKLTKKARIYSISRVKFANEEPLSLEHFYLPYEKFPELTIEELNTSSLFYLLKNKYKIILVMSKEFLEPLVADDYEAQVLGIKKGAPAMMLESTLYIESDQPVMLSRDIIRGDRCKYIIKSNNSIEI